MRKNNVGHVSIFTVFFIIYVSIISIFCNVRQMKSLDSSGTIEGCDYTFNASTGQLIISKSANGDGTVGGFSGNSGIKEVIIQPGITSIGGSAFNSCKNLTSIAIPDTVTSIGGYAFQNCESLTSIILPDSVTSIGEYTFFDCISLTSITIPDSVTSIGICAFEKCSSLTSITIPDSVTSIGNYTFKGCTNLTSITIPDSVTSIGNCTFYDCENLTSITIPDSVTSIGDYAFRGCTNLTSITIPDSVTSIGEGAFKNCTSLTSITIPDSVTSIGEYTFFDCTNLTSVTIPDSVTSIGKNAFSNCGNLTSITIPDSVTSIGKEAFSYCGNLTSITIPASVTSIGEGAFKGCKNLRAKVDENNSVYYSDDGGSIFEKTELTSEMFSLSPSDLKFVYNRSKQVPTISVDLVENTDYKISYKKGSDTVESPEDAGNYQLIITGIGDYKGELTYDFLISKKTITKPAGDTTSFIYNGSEQTYNISESNDYTVTGNKQTNAGTHTITVSLNDKNNTVWSDNTSENINFDFVISKKNIEKPTSDTTSFIYNGSEQTYNIPESNDYTVTGNKQTNAGTHTVTVSLNDKNNTVWSDNTSEDISFDFVISKKNIEKPTENDIPESLSQAQPSDSVYPKGVENLVYDEEEHKLVNPGEKYMGQMYYRIGIDGSWSSDIPVGTDSGSYDIYWYLDGGKDYESVGSRDNPNGPISVSISNWGKLVVNNGVKNYVDSNGMTSAQIFGDGVTWIKEESGGTYAWYGIDNSKRNFKDGSRFWVRWLSKEENPDEWKDYYDKIDDEHKNSVKNDRLWIFLTGVTSPDGTKYKKLENNNDFYIQLGSDWDEDDIVAMFVADDVDEKVNVSFLSDFSSPEGNRQFAKLILTHFSPYAVYDKINKTNIDSSGEDGAKNYENNLSGAGEENQISPSYKKLSDKSYKIVNTGKNKILLPSSLAFFIVFSYLNFLKRKKIS